MGKDFPAKGGIYDCHAFNTTGETLEIFASMQQLHTLWARGLLAVAMVKVVHFLSFQLIMGLNLQVKCSVLCSLFEAFSTFLVFHVKLVSQSICITHYLEDFFVCWWVQV